MWREAKAIHYLCNFSLFLQNCPPRNRQRRRRFGLHWLHSMNYNRFVTVPLCGSLPHFPSISLCRLTLLSACPLLGTLLDNDSTQIALGSLPWEGYCLVWGTNNFDIRVWGIEACLGSPGLRGGAFSPTRPVGRLWLTKLASDEKRMVGPAVAKKRLLNSSFHPCQGSASFSTCLCFDSVKIAELAPTLWLISIPIHWRWPFPADNLLASKAETTEPSKPLLVPHCTPTGASVSCQVLTLSANIYGIGPSLCPVSAVSTLPSSRLPHSHCSSSLLCETCPTPTPVNRCHGGELSRSLIEYNGVLHCSKSTYGFQLQTKLNPNSLAWSKKVPYKIFEQAPLEKIYEWKISTWKMLMLLVIRKCKLNPQLSQRLKLKRSTLSSAGKDAEQIELSYTVGKKVKWYNHFGKMFGSFL